MKNKIDDGRNYAGVIKRLTMEIIRPNDTATYAAGDCVNNLTAQVKKKDTLTLSGLSGASATAAISAAGGLTKVFSAITKQVETITLTGTSGTANITAAGGLTKLATFASSLSTTASNFKIANEAAYLAVGIVLTNSGSTLIFTAQTAGTAFTKPVITNVTSNLAGTVATTYTPTLTALAATFVTDNAAAYLEAGIDLTSSGADLIFEAHVAGVSFVSPIITTLTGTITGTVVNTLANKTYQSQELADAVLFPGGSGVIQDVILELSSVTAAHLGKVYSIYLYNEAITPVADNAALVDLYANRNKFVAKIDVTTAASVVDGADAVIGTAAPGKYFKCADTSKSLFAVLQTPANASNVASVKFNITLLVKQL